MEQKEAKGLRKNSDYELWVHVCVCVYTASGSGDGGNTLEPASWPHSSWWTLWIFRPLFLLPDANLSLPLYSLLVMVTFWCTAVFTKWSSPLHTLIKHLIRIVQPEHIFLIKNNMYEDDFCMNVSCFMLRRDFSSLISIIINNNGPAEGQSRNFVR